MSRVFARGLNFMGQLGLNNGKQNVKEFQEIKTLSGRKVLQVDTHFTQTSCLMEDGQILNWGWFLDALTTARVLSFYKKYTSFAKIWQRYSPFGQTLGLRGGIDEPSLLNKDIVFKHRPIKISMGGCFIHCLTSDGEVFGNGENYKGQLGTGDVKFKMSFAPLEKIFAQKVIDIASGFQHALYVADDGVCYASGRVNWNQFKPYRPSINQKDLQVDYFKSPQKIIFPGEKIIKAGAGFSHSIFLTSKNKLYAIGLNNHGQCGYSSLQKVSMNDYTEVFGMFEPDEYIVDIRAGKSHNILLTNKNNIYGFGATLYNQLNWQNSNKVSFTSFLATQLEICSPRRVDIPLQGGEKIIKIYAKFDRNAVITDKGNCYVWGGENLNHLGGDVNEGIVNLRELIPGNHFVKDVGLGYMHTIVVTSFE